MKTTSIRLDDTLHAQLTVISQLRETSITEIIHTAITSYVESMKSDPSLSGKADSVLATIDEEAQRQREAISMLFGSDEAAEPPAPARGRKPRSEGTK